MKPIVPLFAITGAVVWLTGSSVLGQSSAPLPAANPTPAAANTTSALAPVPPDDDPFVQPEIIKPDNKAQPRFRTTQARKATGGGVAAVEMYPKNGERFQTIVRRAPGGSGKALVVLTSNLSAKEQSDLEEDLTVMSRLLDKTLEEVPGAQHRTPSALGVDLSFVPGASPMRSLYLDGYGALFMMNVGFPLLPSAQKSEENKPQRDSAWEEARAELYGQPSETRAFPEPFEEFSQEKVDKLQSSLLDGLKNATNIRQMKPGDMITLCVSGGASAVGMKYKAMGKGGAPAPPAEEDYLLLGGSKASLRRTLMTLKVRKSDVDAFAQSKLSPEEFRKQVTITTYPGGAWGGAATIFGGTVGFGGGFGGGGTGGSYGTRAEPDTGR